MRERSQNAIHWAELFRRNGPLIDSHQDISFGSRKILQQIRPWQFFLVVVLLLFLHVELVEAASQGTVIAGGKKGIASDELDDPMGLNYHGDILYVADTFNQRVQRCVPSQTEVLYGCTTMMGIVGRKGNHSPYLYEPYNVVFASDGSVYITNTQANDVVRMASASIPQYSKVISAGLNRATAIVLSESNRHLYVADTAHHVVKRFDLDMSQGTVGAMAIFAGVHGVNSSDPGHFDNPVALFFDESTQDLWVADARNNRIVRYPKDSTGPGILEVSMTGRPYGVYLLNGALYYSDFDNCVVYRRLQGLTTIFAGKLNICGSANNRLNNPSGIHVSHDGAVFIADSGNHRVIVWTPEPARVTATCTFSADCVIEFSESNPTPGNMLIIIKDEHNSSCGSFCVPSGLSGSTWKNATRPFALPPDFRKVRFELGAAMVGDLATYKMCWASDANERDFRASSADAYGRLDCSKFKYDVGTLTTELHINIDANGSNNECVKGAPCKITITGYALPDDLNFMSPPTTDWKGTCGDSAQDNFLGYREAMGRNPAIVLSHSRPLWNVTKCVPKRDDYTGPCNCSEPSSAINCHMKHFLNLTTELVVDFGDATGGGPGLVPICMCRVGVRCTAPWAFTYAAGFIRTRSIKEGERFFCLINNVCNLNLEGIFLKNTDIVQIRDLRDADCGRKRGGLFNVSHVLANDRVGISNLRDAPGGSFGAMLAELQIGMVSQDGRYKICYCASYDGDDTGDIQCDDDVEFSMSAGALDIMNVYKENYECPVTFACNISIRGIELVNESERGSVVGPDKIMVDSGGEEICGTVFPLENPLIGDGNVRTLTSGNASVVDFSLGIFAAPGPVQICYCASFVWAPGGAYDGSCNDIMEFYQPLGQLYIRGPQRGQLPCLAETNCVISVPGTRLSTKDRLMLCTSHSSCGNAIPCPKVSPLANDGLLAPTSVSSDLSMASYALGVLDHAAYALCYCAAGNESSPTPLNCTSAAALTMEAGEVRVRGVDKNQTYSCIEGAACSLEVYGFDLSKTDHIMVAAINGTCGTTAEAVSNRLFTPLTIVGAVQGTAATDRRSFEFRLAKESGHFRICYCAESSCLASKNFHLDAGILFVKGLFKAPGVYLCSLNNECNILVNGYGLTAYTDAIQVIPAQYSCGGMQVMFVGDTNATASMNGVYWKGVGNKDERNWYQRPGLQQYLRFDVFNTRWIVGKSLETSIPDSLGYAYAVAPNAKTPDLGIPDGAWKRWSPLAANGNGAWMTDSNLSVRSVQATGTFASNPSKNTSNWTIDGTLGFPYLTQEVFQLGVVRKLGHFKICYCPSLVTNAQYYDNLTCTADDEFPGEVEQLLIQAVRGNEHYHCAIDGICKIRTVFTTTLNSSKMAVALLPAGAICYQAAGAGIQPTNWSTSWIIDGIIVNGEAEFDLDRAETQGVFEVCVCTDYDSGSDGACNNLEEFYQHAGDLTVMPLVRFSKDFGDEFTTTFKLTWGNGLSQSDRLIYSSGLTCAVTGEVSNSISPLEVAADGSEATWSIENASATGIFSACLCANWDGIDNDTIACSTGEEFYARVAVIVINVVKSASTLSSVVSVLQLQMSISSNYSSTGGRRLNSANSAHGNLGILRDAAFAEEVANAIQTSAVASLNAAKNAVTVTVIDVQELQRKSSATHDDVRLGVRFQIRLDGNGETHFLPGCPTMAPLSSSCAAQATRSSQTLACYNERQSLLQCLSVAQLFNGTSFQKQMLSGVTNHLVAANLPGVLSIAAISYDAASLPSVGNTLSRFVCVAGLECEMTITGRTGQTGQSALRLGDELQIISGRELCGAAPGWEGNVLPEARAASGFGVQPLTLSSAKTGQTYEVASPEDAGIFTMCYCWRGPPGSNYPCSLNEYFYQSCGALTVRGVREIEREPCRTHSTCTPRVEGVDLSPFDRVHLIPSKGECGSLQIEPVPATTDLTNLTNFTNLTDHSVQYSPAAALANSLQMGNLLPTGEVPQGAASMLIDLGMVKVIGNYTLCYCASGGSSMQTRASCGDRAEFLGNAGLLTVRGLLANNAERNCAKVDQVLPQGACTFNVEGADIWIGADGIMILPVPGPPCGQALQTVDVNPNPMKLEAQKFPGTNISDTRLWASTSLSMAPRNYTDRAMFSITSAVKEGTYRICSCAAENSQSCTPDGVLGTRTTGIYMNFNFQIGLLIVRGVVGRELFMCREGHACIFEVRGVGLRETDAIEVLGPSESCGWQHSRSDKVTRNIARPVQIFDDGLRAKFDIGTVKSDTRREPVSMRLCYCAGVDSNGDGDACIDSTEFTHAVGFINTVVCPEEPETDVYSPPVQDVHGDAGYPSARLYTTPEDKCSKSNVPLSVRKTLSEPLPLHSAANYSYSVMIASTLGGCDDGLEAEVVRTEVSAQLSISMRYKDGEEKTTGDGLRLSHGHKIWMQSTALDTIGNRFDCPAFEFEVLPMACTQMSAVIYGVVLHGLILLVVCCTTIKRQMGSAVEWSLFLNEMAKNGKRNGDPLVATKVSQATQKPGRFRRMFTFRKAPATEENQDATLIAKRPRTESGESRDSDRGALGGKNPKTMLIDPKCVESRFDAWQMQRRIAKEKYRGDDVRFISALAQPKLCVVIGGLRIAFVFLHLIWMLAIPDEDGSSVREVMCLFVAPLCFVTTSIVGQAVFIWEKRDCASMWTVFGSAAFHSAVAIAKAHLDLALPMLTRKHHCELWRFAIVALVSTMVVQFLVPAFYFWLSLKPLRRQVPSGFIQFGLPTFCTIDDLPQRQEEDTEEEESMEISRDPSRPLATVENLDSMKDTIRSIKMREHELPALQRIRSAWAQDLKVLKKEQRLIKSSKSRLLSRQKTADKYAAEAIVAETKSERQSPTDSENPKALEDMMSDDSDSSGKAEHEWQPTQSKLTRRSSIKDLSVELAAQKYQGCCRWYKLYQTNREWSQNVQKCPEIPCASEELQRHRLVSCLDFLEGSGCFMVTRAGRSSIAPVAGIFCGKHEARWTMMLTVFGGLDLTVIYIFFAIGYRTRLDTWESLAVFLACLLGLFQATRPNVGGSLLGLLADIATTKSKSVLLMLFLLLVRFAVASYGLAPGCPSYTWLFVIMSCSVVVVEYPMLLAYRFYSNYSARSQLLKLRSLLKMAKDGPPEEKVVAVVEAPTELKKTPAKGKKWLAYAPSLAPAFARIENERQKEKLGPEKPPRFTTRDDPQVAAWLRILEGSPIVGLRNNLQIRVDALKQVCDCIESARCGVHVESKSSGLILDVLGNLQMLGYHELRRAQMATRVVQLISSLHFRLGCLRSRARLIQVGLPDAPELRLVHWNEIARLGELPQYEENSSSVRRAIDVFAEFEHNAVLIPVIHRWRSPDHPDPSGITARQLITFAMWYQQQWGQEMQPFFWIDYCCLPDLSRESESKQFNAMPGHTSLQHRMSDKRENEISRHASAPVVLRDSGEGPEAKAKDVQPDIWTNLTDSEGLNPYSNVLGKIDVDSYDALLPLLYAASDAIVMCEAKDSDSRAWVRLETTLAYTFAPSCKKLYSVSHNLGTVRKRKARSRASTTGSRFSPSPATLSRLSHTGMSPTPEYNISVQPAPLLKVDDGGSPAANQRFEVGDQVKVKDRMLSDSKERVELPKGTVGYVLSIDDDSDICVRFDGFETGEWIFRENFGNLSNEAADHAFVVGDLVRVSNSMLSDSTPSIDLPKGIKGNVVVVEDDSICVRFDGFEEGEWIFVEQFGNLIKGQRLRLSQKANPRRETKAKQNKQIFVVGDRVIVSNNMLSDSKQRVELPKGIVGYVVAVDLASDICVRFNGFEGGEWIFVEHFDNLSKEARKRVSQKSGSMAKAKHAFVVGDRVTVSNSMLSDSKQRVELPKGIVGYVVAADIDSDICVRFDGFEEGEWIFAENVGNLINWAEMRLSQKFDSRRVRVAGETKANQRFAVGDQVKVSNRMLSDSKERVDLPKGAIGYVLKVDDDSDICVRFDGFEKGEWIFAENLGNLSNEARMRLSQKSDSRRDSKTKAVSLPIVAASPATIRNSGSCSTGSTEEKLSVHESAIQALERSQTRLWNKFIASPEEWEIARTSLPRDRIRIHQLLRICLGEAPLRMPGGLRRPPVIFGTSLLHVCRLELKKRLKVVTRKRRVPTAPLTPKGPSTDVLTSPKNLRSPSSSTMNMDENDDESDDEDEESDVEEDVDQDLEIGDEALIPLSLRKDRNAPRNPDSPTVSFAHVRKLIDWEEKSKDLYFQSSWYKKERPKQSWETQIGNGNEDVMATSMQKSSLSLSGVKLTASSLQRLPGQARSPSPVRLPAGLPPPSSPKSNYSGSSRGEEKMPSMSRLVSANDLRQSAMAQDVSADFGGRQSPSLPRRPATAADYLMERANKAAMTSQPESRQPLPVFPLEAFTGEERFHPHFLPHTVILSENGRVASQLKANNKTGGLLAEIGLPWRPLAVSPRGTPDPMDSLPSGGMAVTMRQLPLRKGVFPEMPEVEGVSFSVKMEGIDDRWNDGLGIGFTAQDPDLWPQDRSRPRHAAALTSTWMCGHTGRWRLNSMEELIKPFRGKTWKPGLVKVGDVVTIAAALGPVDLLRVLVNGNTAAERQASTAGLTSDHITKLRGVVDVEGSAVSVRMGVGGGALAFAPSSPSSPVMQEKRPRTSLATTPLNWRQRSSAGSRASSPIRKQPQLVD